MTTVLALRYLHLMPNSFIIDYSSQTLCYLGFGMLFLLELANLTSCTLNLNQIICFYVALPIYPIKCPPRCSTFGKDCPWASGKECR